MVGIGLLTIGYAILYWGLHHFPNYHRYSLWTLLGIDQYITPGGGQGIHLGQGGGLQP